MLPYNRVAVTSDPAPNKSLDRAAREFEVMDKELPLLRVWLLFLVGSGATDRVLGRRELPSRVKLSRHIHLR